MVSFRGTKRRNTKKSSQGKEENEEMDPATADDNREGDDKKGKKRDLRNDDDAPSKRKKKKIFLDLAPSQYNYEVFRANNPFVRVQETSEDPISMPMDKIGDGKRMEESTLKTTIFRVLQTPALASCSYKQPRSESGGRIVHGTLALDLWYLTRLSAAISLTMDDLMKSQRRTSHQFDAHIPEDNRDVVVKIGEEAKLKEDDSVDNMHEGEDPDKTTNNRERHDFIFLVNDHRIKDIDKKVVVLVVECEWNNLSKNKIFQAAAYVSKKYGVRNMEKGRFDPIYLQCWEDKNWCYGIFYLFGIVKILNGKVVSTTRFSIPEMEENLSQATKDLQRITKDEAAIYSDGEYIDGVLYVPHEKKFPLPDLTVKGGTSTSGSKLFFQALMRIVIGEKVLSWSEEDVLAAVTIRDQMIMDRINNSWET